MNKKLVKSLIGCGIGELIVTGFIVGLTKSLISKNSEYAEIKEEVSDQKED